MRVLAVCGSLESGSGNLALLKTAAALMPPGVDVVFFEGPGDLPHFNPDLEASGVPESVARWRRALSESDAVLIASPEYGFSLPGTLKNAIDWVIGSGELERKVVAITAATTGPSAAFAACRRFARRCRRCAPRLWVGSRFQTVRPWSPRLPHLCRR